MASTPAKVTTTKTTTTKSAGKTTTSTTTTTSTPVTSASKASTPTKATTTSSAKKTTTAAKLAGAPLDRRWVTGWGDERAVCAPVAVANSLLAVLGVHAADRDIERLYRAAGGRGDSGVPVADALEAAKSDGIAGCRLAGWRPGVHRERDGLLLLLTLGITPDLHAAAYLGRGTVATWGDAVPLTDLSAEIEGAWSLTWHR